MPSPFLSSSDPEELPDRSRVHNWRLHEYHNITCPSATSSRRKTRQPRARARARARARQTRALQHLTKYTTQPRHRKSKCPSSSSCARRPLSKKPSNRPRSRETCPPPQHPLPRLSCPALLLPKKPAHRAVRSSTARPRFPARAKRKSRLRHHRLRRAPGGSRDAWRRSQVQGAPRSAGSSSVFVLARRFSPIRCPCRLTD